MIVRWSALARIDLETQIAGITVRNTTAAVTAVDLIEATTRRLEAFPMMGRQGRVTGTRELVVSRTAYVVAYRVASNEIEILRVMHGAQRWPVSFD